MESPTLLNQSVLFTLLYLQFIAPKKNLNAGTTNFQEDIWGEVYVIAWTILLLGLFIVEMVFQYTYVMPTEVIATYIAVISILAITKKSKGFYLKKKKVTYLK
jgi:hypothetical protein